jgi:signal transduction histidine kinase
MPAGAPAGQRFPAARFHIERWTHGRNESAPHARGAGLGLPLAKALAEIQGGVLSVASTLGEGFTATLELPEG